MHLIVIQLLYQDWSFWWEVFLFVLFICICFNDILTLIVIGIIVIVLIKVVRVPWRVSVVVSRSGGTVDATRVVRSIRIWRLRLVRVDLDLRRGTIEIRRPTWPIRWLDVGARYWWTSLGLEVVTILVLVILPPFVASPMNGAVIIVCEFPLLILIGLIILGLIQRLFRVTRSGIEGRFSFLFFFIIFARLLTMCVRLQLLLNHVGLQVV